MVATATGTTEDDGASAAIGAAIGAATGTTEDDGAGAAEEALATVDAIATGIILVAPPR